MRITLFSLFLALWLAVPAQAKNLKIVLIETMPVPVVLEHSKDIINALEQTAGKNGWVLELEILQAQGKKDLASRLLKESIKNKRPDLVISLATLASQAAKEVLVGSNIPQLFCIVADPIGAGIVRGIGIPSGSNISGVGYTQQRNTKIEMVMRLLASKAESGVKFGVVSSDYPSSLGDLEFYREISQLTQNVEFLPYHFPYQPMPEGLPQMLKELQRGVEELEDQVDFFWEVPGPIGEVEEGTKILLAAEKPLILGNTARAVELGALIAVITDYAATAEQLVAMVEQIFAGTDVGDLPVEFPEKFKLFLNLETAKKMDLIIPSHILMIAGENIFP